MKINVKLLFIDFNESKILLTCLVSLKIKYNMHLFTIDMEYFIIIREGSIVEIGLIVKCMEKGLYIMRMVELLIKGIGKMIHSMVMVFYTTKILKKLIVSLILVILIILKKYGCTTMENSKMMINVGMERCILVMGRSFKGSFRVI